MSENAPVAPIVTEQALRAGSPWAVLWTGPSILLSSIMIAWGAEAAQYFMAQGIALAILAVLHTLPEFAVEAVLAWHQQVEYLFANAGTDFAPLVEAFAKVEANAADPVSSDQAICGGAIPGLLRGLDPHSTFLDPQQTEQLKEMERSERKGFGSVVSVLPGRVIVLQTLPGTPSQKAGLSPGDEIIGINNIPLSRLDFDQLIQLLTETRQHQARIDVRRPGNVRALQFVLRSSLDPVEIVAFALGRGVVVLRRAEETSHQGLVGEAVEEAVHPADRQRADPRHEDAEDGGESVVVDEEMHEERHERVGEPGRQVDLPADQQQHLTERDDDDRCRVLAQVDQVDLGEERGPADRVDEAKVDDQQHHDKEHGRLALPYHKHSGSPQAAPGTILACWLAGGTSRDSGTALGRVAHLGHIPSVCSCSTPAPETGLYH